MQANDVVVKTAKGTEEIKTRACNLHQRLRWLLIMVDGRQTVGGLLDRCRSLGDTQATLNELIAGGYVETISGAPAGTAAASASSVPPGFEDAVRDLTAALHELIGPDADQFARPMENAKNRQEFVTALEAARSMMEAPFGSAKATQFAQRGQALVDKFMPAA